MEKPVILKQKEIRENLKSIPGWKFKKNKIYKEFKFKDFLDSLRFVKKLTPFFQSHDHHPDTHIFYNRVLFELQRFDIGGKVTDRDFMVARKIEKEYKNRKS